jgi:hypothetical protein
MSPSGPIYLLWQRTHIGPDSPKFPHCTNIGYTAEAEEAL